MDIISGKDIKKFAKSALEHALGGRMKDIGSETIAGDKRSVAIVREKDWYPLIGKKHIRTRITAYAEHSDGDIKEKTFGPITSRSRDDNDRKLFLEVNAWCCADSGNNTNLKR